MSDLTGPIEEAILDGAYAGNEPDEIARATAYIVRRAGDGAAEVLAACGLGAA